MEAPVSARAALLLALADAPGTGADLIARIERATDGGLVLSNGSVYPALARIERDGFARSHLEDRDPGEGGDPRRIYTITVAGRAEAERQRGVIAAVARMAPKAKR